MFLKQLPLLLLLANDVSSFSPQRTIQTSTVYQTNHNSNEYSFLSGRIIELDDEKKYFQRHSQRLMCGLIAAIDDIWNQNDNETQQTTFFHDMPLLNDHDKDDENNDILASSTKILHHRGPDGMTVASGILGNEGKARWAMGHTRLAIVADVFRPQDHLIEQRVCEFSALVLLPDV